MLGLADAELTQKKLSQALVSQVRGGRSLSLTGYPPPQRQIDTQSSKLPSHRCSEMAVIHRRRERRGGDYVILQAEYANVCVEIQP